MKIAYITTMNASNENTRIRQEVVNLGHIYAQYNLGNLSLRIKDGKLFGGITHIDDDLLIIRGIMSSLKTISAMAKYLRNNGIKIFDNNFLEHEYSISKITDMVKLTMNGIKVPDTYHLRDFADYKKTAEELGYPVIVKSNRMGKGCGVYKADDKNELETLINKFQSCDREAKNYVIQEYIPYVFDIRALIIGKNVIAMRRIPKKGEFRANFSLGGSVEKYNLDPEGKKLAIDALNAIGMSVGGVDILITKDNKRYILEVNHNAGFTGMEKATGLNIAKMYVKHAIANAK